MMKLRRLGLRDVAGIVLLLLLVGSNPAGALTIGSLDDSGFAAIVGDPVGDILFSAFDFSPMTPGGDGGVTSAVYEGTGAAAGNYVYTYRIDHFATSSEFKISGITFDFGADPIDLPGVGDAFVVDDGGAGVAPTLASYGGGVATFLFFPHLEDGESTLTFGLLSPNAPALEVATILDSGIVFGQPAIWSNGQVPTGQTPEPGAALLFGLGFVAVSRTGLRFRPTRS